MFCFSLEAIDITAALARCAMSRTEAAGAFAADLDSADLVSRRLGDRRLLRRRHVQRELVGRLLRLRRFREPRWFGDTSAPRQAATHRPASSLRRPRRLALRRRRCKPFVKHNRSRHALRRWNHQRPIRQRRKDFVEGRPRRTRGDDGGVPGERRLERGAVHRGIDAGAENVAVDGPGAAQHEASNRDAAEEILRKDSTGRFPAVACRKTKRTRTRTHSHNAQNSSTSSLFDACPKVPGSISQRHGASLRRLLVKCGLNAGRCEARKTGNSPNAWNYCGNCPRNDAGLSHDHAEHSQ